MISKIIDLPVSRNAAHFGFALIAQVDASVDVRIVDVKSSLAADIVQRVLELQKAVELFFLSQFGVHQTLLVAGRQVQSRRKLRAIAAQHRIAVERVSPTVVFGLLVVGYHLAVRSCVH